MILQNAINAKKATGQGDDYAASCLLDYVYFKNIWINFVI